MSVNLIFILLIIEFILFFAFMYLIFNLSDKVNNIDKQIDENMPKIRANLSDIRLNINIIKRQIEENIYSEALVKKDIKAFSNMLVKIQLKKILRLSKKGLSLNSLFDIFKFKSILLYSIKFISK